ncbi:MAG: Na+/H+ antiporter NhaC family protein [Flavobacteriales bacterium]|nr:Na+/H+ antiporter NhaC family protein [Flavobacteriales bacterium]
MLKKIPDTLAIVFSILVIMVLLTWIIPAGAFERTKLENGREVVVAGTYHTTESHPQNAWDLLQAPLKGFENAAAIIAFVILVGGAFALVMSTGAIDAGLIRIIRYTQTNRNKRQLMLGLLMLLFSVCGFTFGMSEESLVFVLMTIPMARSMGYDAVVGLAIPFVTSGVGGAAAAFNPFSVGVAMQISEIPFPSGVWLRTIVWLILTAITIVFILWYASRIEKNPEKSLTYGLKIPAQLSEVKDIEFNAQRLIVILLFVGALVLVPIGATQWDWWVVEIGAVFIGMGLLSVLVMRMRSSDIVSHFTNGAKGMLTAALVICISRSVLIVAQDGQIIDTILFHLSNTISGLPKALSIQVMFLVQGVINFFVPSGSGQAAITMPVMAPMADLLALTRQSAVMAFQFSAGFFDLIIPTSGVTMGVLSIAGIPYNLWLKWIWKLVVIWIIVAMVFLAVTVNLVEWW